MKSIFSSTVSRVISGLVLSSLTLLIPAFREFVLSLWEKVTVFITWAFGAHQVNGLFLFVLLVCAFILFLQFLNWFISHFENKYIEDTISGARWRWKWSGNNPINISPFCPDCDLALAYDDNRYEGFTSASHVAQTQFICDNCNTPKAIIKGGYHDYAISYISREVERRNRDKIISKN